MDLDAFKVYLEGSGVFWLLFGAAVHYGLTEEHKKQLLDWMREKGEAKYAKIISSLHSRFLGIFRDCYMDSDQPPRTKALSDLNRALWFFIVVASIVALSCSLVYGWIGTKGQLELVLLMSLSGAFVATLVYVLRSKKSETRSKLLHRRLLRAGIFILIAVLTFVAAIYLFEWRYPNELISFAGKTDAFSSYSKHGAIFVIRFKLVPDVEIPLSLVWMGILIGSACGIFTALSARSAEASWTGVVAGILTGFLSGLIGYHAIVGWQNMPAHKLAETMMFVGIAIAIPPFMLAFIWTIRDELSSLLSTCFRFVCKYRAHFILIISFISMAFITFLTFRIRRDVFDQFIKAMATTNVVYLALNMIADSFSVIETHWILRKVQCMSNYLLIGVFLLLDLAASSAIYLLIPVGTRSYEVFPAIWFSGSKPWLGIFFWSTFSTSLIFYLFVASFFLFTIVEPLRRPLLGLSSKLKSPGYPAALVGFVITTIGGMILFLLS